MLGPSSITSTGAVSLTGNLRGLRVLAALTSARGSLDTLLGAVNATTSYAVVVRGSPCLLGKPNELSLTAYNPFNNERVEIDTGLDTAP